MSQEKSRPANILVVEDDQAYAERVIAPHFEDDWRVRIAYNVPQSLQALDEIVDLKLAIVDLDIPGGTEEVKRSGGAGFEVIDLLKERFPGSRVVILTNHLTPMLVNRAQKLKVEYVSKGDCRANLRVIADDLMRAELDGESEPAVRVAQRVAKESGLSERQTEVLMMLLQSLTREEIARELGISDWTLKSHIREIVRRTGFSRTQELLRMIRRTARSS
jgi:DNA-binding NarL/FixJ family response regulator